MKWSKFIPDRTRVCSAEGQRFLVFNPAWWRLDRWLAWVWITRVQRRGVFRLSFTAVQRDEEGHRLVTFKLSAHAEK